MCRATLDGMGTDPSKVGTGKGRQSARRTIARKNGDLKTAEELTPPSERRLTDDERCGALNQPGAIHKFCQVQKGSRTDHPGYGTCAKHGGNTEAGVKSAMREMGADLARKFKAEQRFGGDRRDPSLATLTPEQALLEEVRRSAAFVRFLEERIARWNLTPLQAHTLEKFVEANNATRQTAKRRRADAPSLAQHLEQLLNDLPLEDPDSPGYLPPLTDRHPNTGIVSFTDAREWLYLYREERGHLARVAKMCIDAGVASRLVTLAEDQGRILATAIRAVLSALSLTPEQARLIPQIVPPILRAVANDQPLPDPGMLALQASTNNAS